MLKTKAVFERKLDCFQPQDCVIEAIEELSAAEFKDFCENMLADRNFIADRIGDMYVDGNGVQHGLLVLGEDTDDAVLVDSSGYSYGRYTAFLPNFRPYVNRQISLLADEIIRDGTQKTESGNREISFDEIEEQYGVHVTPNNGIGTMLLNALSASDEVAEIEPMEDNFDITYYLDYCPKCNGQQERGSEKATEQIAPVAKLRDMLHTKWEDIHLIHHEIENEPSTIVELDEFTLTDAGKEAWADVLNADVLRVYTGYYGLQMELAGVKASRLDAFSSMLAGFCSVQDYEKWVNEPEDHPSQTPEMKL